MAKTAGFSTVELLVAMGILLSIMAGALTLVRAVQLGFARDGERTDMQQRLRVAGHSIHRDLIMAGAGGPRSGPLGAIVASVLPFRQGARDADPPGTFASGTMTVMYVPGTTAAQTTIREPLPARSGLIPINLGDGCPPGDPACGFAVGMDVIVYDQTPSHDTFRVVGVQGEWLQLRHDRLDTPFVYPAGSTIVEAVNHTYHLRSDAAAGTYQLMRYDGAGSDVAVVDHVVDLSFRYFGESRPPTLVRPVTDPSGPWTTYGPRPPLTTEQPSLYPRGENCVFQTAVDGSGLIPRLPALDGGAEASLIELSPAQLTDGPWCPDSASLHRFDADLLRIRTIDVTLRVESALSSLRGPAGTLFRRGGSSRAGERWLPDLEAQFTVAPRNLNGGR